MLDRLEVAGFGRPEEAGRSIIRDQLAIGGVAVPWGPAPVHGDGTCWELRSYRCAAGGRLVFFARGLPEVVGYLRMEGLPVSPRVHAAAGELPYHRRVLIASPWSEIYEDDHERKQSLGEAERTCESMVAIHQECGYELMILPRSIPEERMRFVLAPLSQN